MLNTELLRNVLIISVASGVVTSLTVQKIKELVKSKNAVYFASIAVSMIVGTAFAKLFSDISWLYAIWCGYFTFIDATLLYDMLEDKVFTKFSDMEQSIDLDSKDSE